MKQEIITVFGKRYKAVAKFSNKEADMIEIEPLSEIDELKVKIDSLESKIGEINSKIDTFTMLNDKLAVRNAQLEAKIKELEHKDIPAIKRKDDSVNDLIAHCKPRELF